MRAQAAAGIFTTLFDATSQLLWYAVSKVTGFDMEDRRWITVLEMFGNSFSFAIYVIGFIYSLRAVNTLAQNKVTLWAIKMHAEEEKK